MKVNKSYEFLIGSVSRKWSECISTGYWGVFVERYVTVNVTLTVTKKVKGLPYQNQKETHLIPFLAPRYSTTEYARVILETPGMTQSKFQFCPLT